jgi:putative transcriptional regulator
VNSLHGQFLIASPHLTDENFYRSVIFMVSHDQQGAVGFVLNRPMVSPMEEIWAELEVDVESGKIIYLGGPVPGPILVLHGDRDLGESTVIDGVYLATRKDHVQTVLASSETPHRILVGYSGWGPGQLEREMQGGGWLTHPADASSVFSDRDDLWEHLVHCVANRIMASKITGVQRPDDPRYN